MKKIRRRHIGTVFDPLILRHRLASLFRQPIFIWITVWGHTCILAGTVGFYLLEHESNPKVHSLLDSLFWTVSTVTTVGYGDITPLTVGGKILAMFMMVLGFLFLWSYTGLFAGAIIAPELRYVEREVNDLESGILIAKQEMRAEEQNIQETLAKLEDTIRQLRSVVKNRENR